MDFENPTDSLLFQLLQEREKKKMEQTMFRNAKEEEHFTNWSEFSKFHLFILILHHPLTHDIYLMKLIIVWCIFHKIKDYPSNL